MAATPTQRTLVKARQDGYAAAVVERWGPVSRKQPDGTYKIVPYGKRHDLFGAIDIVCIHPGVGILGVQATSRSNHNARMNKAKAIPEIKLWLESGGKFEVWSWAKTGLRGKRKLWRVKREVLKLEDMQVS